MHLRMAIATVNGFTGTISSAGPLQQLPRDRADIDAVSNGTYRWSNLLAAFAPGMATIAAAAHMVAKMGKRDG
jgi:hypothetical protein